MKKKYSSIIILILTLALFAACSKKGLIENSISTGGDFIPADSAEVVLIPGNSVIDSGVEDLKTATGTFNVTMGPYRGELATYVKDGRFYGTLKFYNWGNGTPQPLKNLRINNNRIYFVRSITTKDELERYGGTAYFTQEFFGIFSADGNLIRGYYRYLGAQDNWEAKRN